MDNLVGDEFAGAERKLPLKERMATSLKEVQKLSAHAKSTVGLAGGPFTGKARRRCGRGGLKEPDAKGNLTLGLRNPRQLLGDS